MTYNLNKRWNERSNAPTEPSSLCPKTLLEHANSRVKIFVSNLKSIKHHPKAGLQFYASRYLWKSIIRLLKKAQS